MKYRDPKTGEVYRGITPAWEAFCAGLTDACSVCPLTASKTGRNLTCNDFVVKHEAEAARRMGLEVTTDEEETMEKKLPRICEMILEELGVEINEEWRVTGNDMATYRINEDGEFEYAMPLYRRPGHGRWRGSDIAHLLDFVSHPDRIIRKPRFTPEEVAVLDYACKCCGIDCTGVLERLQGGALKLHGDGVEVFFPGEFFPSLRPGQSVALADIVHR